MCAGALGPLDHAGRATLAHRIIDDPVLAERLAAEHGSAPTSAFVALCCDASPAGHVLPPQVDLGPMRTAP